MPDAGDIRWMTYAEIRDAFALPSTKAAVQRSRRAGWPRRQNNADKFARVAVPVAALAAPRNPSHEASRNPPVVVLARGNGIAGGLPGGATDPHGVNAVLAELKASHDRLAGELRGRAERAEAEMMRLQGDVQAGREREDALLARALAAEARLAAGSPGARAFKALRGLLARRGRP